MVTSYRRSGEDRDRSRSAPSSTVKRPSKSGNGQATMTVAVPQESNKHQVQTHDMRVLPVVNVNWGSIRVTRRNEGVLPPQSIPVKHDCVSLWKWITNDPFVSSIVAKGYRLRFMSPPLLLQTPWEIRFPQGA